MSRVFGYVLGAAHELNGDEQEAAMRAAGVERVFHDRPGIAPAGSRPQWRACMGHVRAGDTLVIPSLAHLARTESAAIEAICDLGRRGVRLRSLTEPLVDVDSATPTGQAIIGLMNMLSQLRASDLGESTRRGLARARAQGRVGGRPSVMTPERTTTAIQMRRDGHSIVHIAQVLGVGKSSVARALSKSDALTAAEVSTHQLRASSSA